MDGIECEAQFVKWIDEYQSLILSICYKMTQDYFTAQDLTQDTFLSAYEHREGFDGGNEKAWLCRIATNKCIDYMRQAGRRLIPVEDTQLEEYQSHTRRPEEEALEQSVKRELLENCRGLKPPYDEIAYQYFYLEKKPDEIAAEQGKNRKTVQTQIYRAREMLRRLYRRERWRAETDEGTEQKVTGNIPGEKKEGRKEKQDG